MSILFRFVLILGAVAALAYVLTKIRKSEIKIADSTFWFVFCLGVVVLAVFPQIAYACCTVLGVISPVNFVFLAIITILVIHQFSTTVEMAKLRNKLNTLVQQEALESYEQQHRS